MNKVVKVKIVNKKRFIGFIASILIAAGIIIVFLLNQTPVQGKAQRDYIHFHVTAGDTLWHIARQYNPNGEDIRAFIYKIMTENNMKTAMLSPGQKIKIPVQ
ncbi:MAG: LysM peptidoglycan-binding domain-containing protein [Firmicutes bacterium]|nr:LysM peptidoglycan-binding domain-containing protein [Bacillota bacterium]